MASTAVGKFYGEFGLDIDPFLKSIRDIQRETKAMESSLKPLTRATEDMGKAFLASGVAITGALGLMVKQASDYGDSIRDASIRTGVSTEALGGLRLAAEQSGASFEDLNLGLKKLAVNADMAAKGSKQQEEAFKSIGVSVKDVNGQQRQLGDILGDVSEHFKKSTNATKEAGEAVELFGRNGTQLIEFLELGKSGLQEFQEKAQRLGLSIGVDVANEADKFKDTLNDLHAAELGAAIGIGNALLPALTELTVKLTNVIVKAGEFADKHRDLTEAAAILGVTLIGAGGLVYSLGKVLEILPKIADAFKVLDTVMALNPVGALVVALGAAVVGIYTFRYTLEAGVIGIVRIAIMYFGALAKAAGTLATAMGATGLGKTLKDAGTDILDFSDYLLTMRNSLLNTEDVSGTAAKMTEAYAAAHKKLKDGIVENNAEMTAAAAAAKRYQEGIDHLTSSVVPSGDEISQMTNAIVHLYHEGVPVEKMLDGLGKKAADMAAGMRAAGIDIPGAINVVEIAERAKELKKAFQKIIDDYQKDVERAQERTNEGMNKMTFTFFDALVRMYQAWDDVNGKEFDDQVQLFNKINGLRKTDLDEKVEFDEAWTKALNKAYEKRLADYKKSLEDIKRASGAIFDDMFIKGENVFRSFRNMIKGGILSIGRALFEDINAALFGPILNVFRNFFETTLKGIINGALGGIGNTIGRALGGIFGGGVPHLPGGAAGPVLTGGGIGGGLFGLSGAATLGIGAAVGAAIIAITHFVGGGRKKADEFGQEVQVPFGSALSSIINPFDALKASGKLTLDLANQAKDSLTSLWTNFVSSANQFATQGKNQAKVVSQAFSTMTEDFGPNLSNLFKKINDSITALSAQAPSSSQIKSAVTSTAGLPETGRAISASTIFATAVNVFKDSVDKVSGPKLNSDQIVLNVNSAPVFNISVDSSDLVFKVRDVFIPEIVKDLSLNMNGALSDVIELIKKNWNGVVTTGGATA